MRDRSACLQLFVSTTALHLATAIQLTGLADSGNRSGKKARESMLLDPDLMRVNGPDASGNAEDVAVSRLGAESDVGSFHACGDTWSYGDVVYWSRAPSVESHIACASASDDDTIGICRGDGRGHKHFAFCKNPPAGECAGMNGRLWFVFCDDLARKTEAPTSSPTGPPTAAPTSSPTSSPTGPPTAAPTGPALDAPAAAPAVGVLPPGTSAPTPAGPAPPMPQPAVAPDFTMPTPAPTEAAPVMPQPAVAPDFTMPTPAPTEAAPVMPQPAVAPAVAVPTPAPTEAAPVMPQPAVAPAVAAAPTAAPTASPSASPTEAPTAAPTASPTDAPTAAPTPSPSASPTTAPTAAPTPSPSASPTAAPTAEPTAAPTASPTAAPTAAPTSSPTGAPTLAPTAAPTASPTSAPTAGPTVSPTAMPTSAPTGAPTAEPTATPTASPSGAPTAGPTAGPTAAPTSPPTAAPIAADVAQAPAAQSPAQAAPLVQAPPAPIHDVGSSASDSATVHDDPHVSNLRNERFDIRRPSEYQLLRVPLDERLPAAMELTAGMAADASTKCGVYVKNVTFRGTWFNGQTVRVRPHTRDLAGSNQAGSETRTNFSLQVSRQQAPQQRWRSFSREEASSLISEASTEQVEARFIMREEYGERLEGQALEFRMGEAAEATIVISQAAHQALNIDMRHLSKLGEDRVGGLLGTEPHDKEIEQEAVECKAEAVKRHRVERKAEELISERSGASRLKATWL